MDGVFSSPAGRFQAYPNTSASNRGRNANAANSSTHAASPYRFEPITETLSLACQQPDSAQAWRTVAWSIASALRDSRTQPLPS